MSSCQLTPYGSGFLSMRTYRYVYDSHAIASFTFVTVPAQHDIQESVQAHVSLTATASRYM